MQSSANNVASQTKRILYVDDMRELREVAQLALTRSGHLVECAADGTEAFEKIVANPGFFDIVITDHHMAETNGVELVMKLREIHYPGRIAIVSSELNEDVTEDYHRLGVTRILYKPIDLRSLRALVDQE